MPPPRNTPAKALPSIPFAPTPTHTHPGITPRHTLTQAHTHTGTHPGTHPHRHTQANSPASLETFTTHHRLHTTFLTTTLSA
eukprot:355565-Chlamydomonas_euryale.AAC.1